MTLTTENLGLAPVEENTLKAKMIPVTEYAGNLGAITTPEVYKEASSYVFAIKDFNKLVGDYFDADIKKAHELHRSLTGKKRVFTDALDWAEVLINNRLSEYRDIEKRRIANEQALALEKQRKLNEEAEAKAKKLIKAGKIEQAQAVVENIPQVPVVVSEPIKVQGQSSRELWSATIVDIDKVPRKFLIPDMSALDKLAQACKGNITVPGVKFTSRTSMTNRTSR